MALFGAFAILGALVSVGPPGAFDSAADALVGQAPGLALALTSIGLFPAYVVLCVFVLALGVVRRVRLDDAVASVLALAVMWKISDLAKDYFARPRPEHWILRPETSYSYPSGHTVLSMTFYGFWAAAVWSGSLSAGPKRALLLGFAALVAGIGWSRLALGAHFPTDLLGGYLLGAAAVVLTRLALAVVRNRRAAA